MRFSLMAMMMMAIDEGRCKKEEEGTLGIYSTIFILLIGIPFCCMLPYHFTNKNVANNSQTRHRAH